MAETAFCIFDFEIDPIFLLGVGVALTSTPTCMFDIAYSKESILLSRDGFSGAVGDV